MQEISFILYLARAKSGRNYYYRRVPTCFFYSLPTTRRGRVLNSRKRLSSVRAARSPAFMPEWLVNHSTETGVRARRGRQRATESQGKKAHESQSRRNNHELSLGDDTLSRAFPLARGPFLRNFFSRTVEESGFSLNSRVLQRASVIYACNMIFLCSCFMHKVNETYNLYNLTWCGYRITTSRFDIERDILFLSLWERHKKKKLCFK